MESWSVRKPVRLPGAGRQLRLYDTASRRVCPAGPGATVRMYVCGITPYDATHLGHAATFVAFDTANRVWLDAGREVRYVQNVTDVDDPLLERAQATGQDWRELARAETESFRRDMEALSVLPPREYVGVVESIPSIVEWILRLRDAGALYELEGDLYFAAGQSPAVGSIAGMDVAAMSATFAERGGDPARPGKRDPLDCLVWRAARPDEPAWDTALGRGRPGWHIECTAIALDHLGVGFDVQGGGSDLAFPHHEMCTALGEAATGRRPFARHHVHSGMVAHAGHKMSKSRGNLVFVSGLLGGGVPPAVIRLALLGHHYRGDWEWGAADLGA
ncbi:MAG: cysteine--1-D-myo-inosityl 2-amino-2-deoxy-alpha-D-glucopyranoside ligase, partial [Candidatus Nanopelagicales bacterium]